jgi:hypothetical protein
VQVAYASQKNQALYGYANGHADGSLTGNSVEQPYSAGSIVMQLKSTNEDVVQVGKDEGCFIKGTITIM